jgi:hypothetical protein
MPRYPHLEHGTANSSATLSAFSTRTGVEQRLQITMVFDGATAEVNSVDGKLWSKFAIKSKAQLIAGLRGGLEDYRPNDTAAPNNVRADQQ